MYARILKFLTNLLFKQVFRGCFPGRKKRLPRQTHWCAVCGDGFPAFNKRQRICQRPICIKGDRARQYRARIKFAESLKKANMEAIQTGDRDTAAIIIGPTLESEE